MPNLKFLIVDDDPGTPGTPNPDYGVPYALDPARATGIPIPAFRSGPVTPVVGTTAGEAFLNTTSDQGFVWDGTRWNPIAPSAITRYPSDADVLNDTAAATGTYGTAEDTGNLFIMTTTGWRMVGVRTYTNMASLLADNPGDGSIGVAMAENSVWLRVNGTWMPQSPVMYQTEVLLLADTPPDGTIGMASDTGLIYGRINGVWRRANSPTITVAATAPTTPALGDLHFDDTTGTGMVWTGVQWVSMNAEPIGEIKFYAGATPPPNFLVCDGSPIPAQFPLLIALIGANTPDLRGQFLRGGTPETGFTRHQWTTGLPRTRFSTDSQGNHNHGYTGQQGTGYPDGAGDSTGVGNGQSYPRVTQLVNTGAHTHQVTSGGDLETAPNHVIMLPIIRAA